MTTVFDMANSTAIIICYLIPPSGGVCSLTFRKQEIMHAFAISQFYRLMPEKMKEECHETFNLMYNLDFMDYRMHRKCFH